MDLVSILILLIVVGAVLYGVSMLPIDATIKRLIYLVAIVVVAIYLLRALAPALSL
jgi:hypothetical protein